MRPANQETISDNDGSKTQLIENMISSFDKKLDKLSVNTSYVYASSIYKVSQKFRKENEASYTPRLVSIGPLHHDQGQLQDMEAFKLRFLQKFLNTFGIGLHTLVIFAAKKESFVRGCYDGGVSLSPQQLAEVILLDGVFIVELFLENYFFQLRDRYETIFENKLMFNDLLHDMLLLENQLPISIMESLLSFVDLSFLKKGTMVTIYDLAHRFFKNAGSTGKIPLTPSCSHARHFVDFLLVLHYPAPKKTELMKKLSRARKSEYTRSAGELIAAGVKLRSGEGDCLFEVLFEFERGVLTIPKLTVNELTETFFRNLIAFEHVGYYGDFSKNITSYVMLMDRLVDTSGDVDLLVKHGIIENKLGKSQQVADLFNNLYKGNLTEADNFYFANICGGLNDYKGNVIHRSKAWLFRMRQKYFSNSWSFLSFLAANVLLALTIVQTICSILQVV